jgi:hypothetical protein
MLAVYIAGKLYQLIVELYIKRIPLWAYILGFITIIFGSNIFILMRGLKYDIAISCGILFITLTIYTLLSLHNMKKTRLKLILAGIFMSFVVCSKPTFILHYILIFYIIYKVWKKYIVNKKDIIFMMVPCVILGIGQMIYNYVRYDSIFEFGAKYQLTGFYVLTYMVFSWQRIFRGMKYCIFELPTLNLKRFPYIFMNLGNDNDMYDEFLYENYFVGLISFPVIILAIICILDRKTKNKELSLIKRCFFITLITYLLSIILNMICAGVSETYSLDVKWTLLFASVVYILKYVNLNHDSKVIKTIFILACILNIIIIIPISYSGESLCFLSLIESTIDILY